MRVKFFLYVWMECVKCRCDLSTGHVGKCSSSTTFFFMWCFTDFIRSIRGKTVLILGHLFSNPALDWLTLLVFNKNFRLARASIHTIETLKLPSSLEKDLLYQILVYATNTEKKLLFYPKYNVATLYSNYLFKMSKV